MLDLIRQRAQSWGVKIAFGIIIIVFVFWGVGNMGQTGPDVAAMVNGKPIRLQEYARALRAREDMIRAQLPGITPEMMQSFGLGRETLKQLVSRALIEQEAARLGMSVSPLELYREVSQVPEFQGPDGKFSQERYESLLRAQGINVADFERDAMRDILGDKLYDAVTSAVTATPDEARRRVAFQMEKRTVAYVLFPIDEFREGVTVSDDAIQKYYDANQPEFAEPAMTSVRYLDVRPANLAETVAVTDEEVEAAFARGPFRYSLRQVVIPVPQDADEAAETAVRTRLETLAAEIRSGKDFPQAAREVSDDPLAGADMGWINASQLNSSVLGALAGLKKGDVTQPVRLGTGYALLQLVDSDPDWSMSEDGIRSALRKSLAQDKAGLALPDVREKAEDLMALDKPLDEIAAELGLKVESTGLATANDTALALELTDASQASMLFGEPGSLVQAVFETRDGFAVAQIGEQKAAGIKPLEAVKEHIVDVLVRQEAERRSEEAARAAVSGFASGIPDAFKDKMVVSEAFTRQEAVPDLGLARPLIDAVFSHGPDQWFGQPFATPRGAVIAMTAEVIPMSDADWLPVQDQAVDSLLRSKKNQVFTAYLADLGSKAEIVVGDPQIFE